MIFKLDRDNMIFGYNTIYCSTSTYRGYLHISGIVEKSRVDKMLDSFPFNAMDKNSRISIGLPFTLLYVLQIT